MKRIIRLHMRGAIALITLAALCVAIPSYAMDTAEDSAEQDKSSEVTIVDSQKQRDYLVFCTACFKKVCTSSALNSFNTNPNHKCDPSKFDFDPDTYERCSLLNEHGKQCHYILRKNTPNLNNHINKHHSSKRGTKRKKTEDGARPKKKQKSKVTLVSCRTCAKRLFLSTDTSKPLKNQTTYHQRHAKECTNPVLEFTEKATTDFDRCDQCVRLLSKSDKTNQRAKHKCFYYPITKSTTSALMPTSHSNPAAPIPAAEPATIAASSSAASIDLPAPAAFPDDHAEPASTFNFSDKPGDESELFPAFNPGVVQTEAEDDHDDLLSLAMPLAAGDAEHYEYSPDNSIPFSLSLPMPREEEL